MIFMFVSVCSDTWHTNTAISLSTPSYIHSTFSSWFSKEYTPSRASSNFQPRARQAISSLFSWVTPIGLFFLWSRNPSSAVREKTFSCGTGIAPCALSASNTTRLFSFSANKMHFRCRVLRPSTNAFCFSPCCILSCRSFSSHLSLCIHCYRKKTELLGLCSWDQSRYCPPIFTLQRLLLRGLLRKLSEGLARFFN